jgi:glycosyltransferase involved in cell wall biosynthesis
MAVLAFIGVGCAVVAVLTRWATWRWLAVLAGLLGALLARPTTDASAALLLALSGLLAAALWRSRRRPAGIAAGVTAAAGLLGVVLHPEDTGATAGSVELLLAGAGLLLALAAAIGLARADATELRWASGMALAAPLAAAVAGGSALPVLAWGPAAGALGVTALLRGRRGSGSRLPQQDAVDEAAVAAFRTRYGEPVLSPVVVVVAAYNEAGGLPNVLSALPREVCGLRVDVLVVDDGSSDGTAELAGSTRAYVVACRANRGQGAALRLGYRVAREHGAAYIVTSDADGQYAAGDLPTVLRPILEDRADWVTGSRVLGRTEARDRVRRTGTWVFATLAGALTGRRLTDTSFGLRAMRAEVTRRVTLNQPRYQSSELMMGVLSHGFRTLEVPATMHARSAGHSKKGGNLAYGSAYARVLVGTWLREGCPRPVTETAPAVGGSARSRLPTAVRDRLGSWWRTDRLFLIALGLGAAVRLLVMLAFPPAFVFSDGPAYLSFADSLQPSQDRPIGYSLFLWGLRPLSSSVLLIAIVQHLLGLATAVVGYTWLRRWGVSGLVATLATLPLLFDTMQLSLEHSVLSDVLFDLLILGGLAAVAWTPTPRLRMAALAGLLIGVATVVRVVGQPVVLVVVAYLVLVARPVRLKAATVAVAVVAFALPVAAYAGWYHHTWGRWAVTEAGGRSLYMRSTTFVDCSRLVLPSYERPLCPAEPVGHRLDPTEYGWHNPAVTNLRVPAGSTRDEVLRDFGRRAVAAQPDDYLRDVARDFAMPFWMSARVDRYEYDTAHKWSFPFWVDYEPTSFTRPAYLTYGGMLPTVNQPLADLLAVYSGVALSGPVLLALLAVALAGLIPRRAEPVSRRPVILLVLATGLGLMLAPDVSAQFTWRYQLPGVMLLPMAAALGWTRLRMPRRAMSSSSLVAAQPTRATASTD